jgi:hypothetical protein
VSGEKKKGDKRVSEIPLNVHLEILKCALRGCLHSIVQSRIIFRAAAVIKHLAQLKRNLKNSRFFRLFKGLSYNWGDKYKVPETNNLNN